MVRHIDKTSATIHVDMVRVDTCSNLAADGSYIAASVQAISLDLTRGGSNNIGKLIGGTGRWIAGRRSASSAIVSTAATCGKVEQWNDRKDRDRSDQRSPQRGYCEGKCDAHGDGLLSMTDPTALHPQSAPRGGMVVGASRPHSHCTDRYGHC